MIRNQKSVGMPVGGFNLQSVPARALNPSFAEVTVPDTTSQFASDWWRDEIITSILAANTEVLHADLPSPETVVDRIGSDIQSKLRCALDSKKMGTDGPAVLEELQNESGPFIDLSSSIEDLFASIEKAIRHYSEDLTRHPVAILRTFTEELRATAEKFAFERPVSMGEETDRLERMCRFTNSVMESNEIVPPLVRDKVLIELRSLNTNLAISTAQVIVDDMLRARISSARRLCLDTADQFESHIRHRVGRLEEVGRHLARIVEDAANLSGRQREAQTIFLPEASPGELLDRLATKLKVASRSNVAKAFIKKFEAVLNQQAVEQQQVPEPLDIEDLLRLLSPEVILTRYDGLIRDLLVDEQSILDLVAADVEGYADQLVGRAMPTIHFADRDSAEFGIAANLTAYLIIPHGETGFQQHVLKRFLDRLDVHPLIGRVECSHDAGNSIELMICKSPFVIGTQVGLLASLDAFINAGGEHNPSLYGPQFGTLPTVDDADQYRSNFN
jgi:hypothetical protein